MNKSEIYEIAAELEQGIERTGVTSPFMEALIQAAALLKEMDAELASIKQQVVFVDEGEVPMVGDWVTIRPNDPNAQPMKYYGDENVEDEAHMKQFKILMRNNQPVLVRK